MRIASLWEGTTQIQALDLLGRKVLLQKLRPINEHCAELRALSAEALGLSAEQKAVLARKEKEIVVARQKKAPSEAAAPMG